MGVYTPTTLVDADLMTRIEREIVRPAVETMAKEGNPLRGVLYPGLMLTPAGPKLIEFNCRFGDPEAQVVLPTTRGDLGEWCLAVADGSLDTTPDPVQEGAAVGVALASGGYPGSYETGKPIHGLESVASDPNVIVFHAGTKRLDSGEIVTAGGRVLTVVGLGPDLATARTRAYAAAGEITFDGRHMRSDIAVRELPALRYPAQCVERRQSVVAEGQDTIRSQTSSPSLCPSPVLSSAAKHPRRAPAAGDGSNIHRVGGELDWRGARSRPVRRSSGSRPCAVKHKLSVERGPGYGACSTRHC